MSLLPFNKWRRCRKCGSQASSYYTRELGKNRIHRVCHECGFEWDEAPKDYDAEKEHKNMLENWRQQTEFFKAMFGK